MITKSDLRKAAQILEREMPGELTDTLRFLSEGNKDDEVELFDRNNYFASVLWCDDDIIKELSEQGFKTTDENVAFVIEYLDDNYIEDVMIERGWDVIQAAIREAKEYGSLEKEVKDNIDTEFTKDLVALIKSKIEKYNNIN